MATGVKGNEADEMGNLKLISLILGCALALVAVVYLSVKVHGYLEESIEKNPVPEDDD